ncbi:YbhB/YbcL family Raf kinase inhibitor-like protein [Legionella micdadei]|uniref:Phosphatidylethanolamine-binding protein n=1 Tax=Legionella micdadei TaxID=451 RepID=A0A098GCK4_LEGMI|nr:YbhB/YbcL family Raf kinase inhibitor-like protein [Legionella micdadei]KTD27588.1 phosphatidylethanolamine-binding protein PebP [Legionella micdadei]NSL19648.1 YbhB/YbcL family Raf kinase inhibitor-like protein [Legionella micdadei]CEG59725.1 conserved protein of unknown function [Phosphatidylethanolamine-binding protein PEBP] [Legionella micdadei]SCY80828.1 hypothetical protein SAMN02982997_03002 [Legionella micdadei]
MSLSLESTAFISNTMIPSQYTCDGLDSSPPLAWQDSSAQTRSYVLIVDDPDAPGGTWDHWVLFNIPAAVKQLPEGSVKPEGALDGKNSWGSLGYRGPCPPSGVHHYHFKLYALDSTLNLPSGVGKQAVMQAMKGHILGSTELIGLYRKG